MAPKRKAPAKATKPLDGFVICQTGTMTVTRKEIDELITDHGGEVKDRITNAVTHLVCAPDGRSTSKYSQAQAKGIKIISEEELRDLIDGKAPAAKAAEPEEAPESPPKKPAASSRPKRGQKRAAESDDEQEAEAPPAKQAKSETAKSASTKSKVIKKGRGVVDAHSGLAATAHIFEEGDDVYMCMLNQTNIGQNNNKFYVLQLIEADAGGKWWVWTRWARVGQVGQSKLEPCPSLAKAKTVFNAKFREKTLNNWADRADFVKHQGKYFLMEMDYGDDDDGDEGGAAKADQKLPECKLPKRVQDIVAMISDQKMMTKALAELEIDVKKMPLGKISKTQIKQGYEILKKIDAELKGAKRNSTLVQLSSDFYTIIPHDFGMRTPEVINTDRQFQRKVELLDTMADLEIAKKLLDQGGPLTENPLDATYKKLKCPMVPMDKTSATYRMLCDYVENTHGSTHTAYHLEVEDILEIAREGEEEKFADAKRDIDNHMLLWHGSRLTNFMGILSQGLRIAPPEAPVTGYMFGKGVYFADMVTKSANYCHVQRSSPTGLMFLADVALGNMYKLQAAKYMDKAPAGFHSTMGEGKMAPNPTGDKFLDGVRVPCGTQHTPEDVVKKGTVLLYNEFIVYDTAQINLKYLLKLKFNFK